MTPPDQQHPCKVAIDLKALAPTQNVGKLILHLLGEFVKGELAKGELNLNIPEFISKFKRRY